jgi:Mor family transcriptional regulator
MVDNIDIFTDFFEKIQNGCTMSDVLKEYGGSNIYIPSYKTVMRDDEIREEFLQRVGRGQSVSSIIKDLSREHQLSNSRVYSITEDLREPSLF